MLSSNILDKLTNVNLENKFNEPSATSFFDCDEYSFPLYTVNTVIVGSGAAGLRAAVELKRRNVDVIVVTSMLYAGTSACSGSDKQTLFTASTGKNGDNVYAVAKAIAAGGAMDGDLAYVEAAGSFLAMDGLRLYGLPLPEDKFGAVLRYKTDHDEAGRATSCGPRTSRLMVKALSNEAMRLGVSLLDDCTIIKILKRSHEESVNGLIGISKKFVKDNNPFGIVIFKCCNVILAGGGAGELYKHSAYPYGCVGTVGLALDAGISVNNIQEQQFGISTDKSTFAWNLSGTYMQAIPRIFSQDKEGNVYNFLKNYYRSTKEIASNIFRKGYQWPVHAQKMLNFGSSLIDLAIFREIQKGRDVFLDFLHNPDSGDDDKSFSLNELDEDVYVYLKNAEALLDLPIDRLNKMNPLSIELYKVNGIYLAKNPLKVGVNHQHFNGGIRVNIWGESELKGCFAIGESAGTHGVTRPGGSALNSGQVFAIRSAQFIENQNTPIDEEPVDLKKIKEILDFAGKSFNSNGIGLQELKQKVQTLMSEKVAFICNLGGLQEALNTVDQLIESVRKDGITVKHNSQLFSVFEWKNLLIEAKAIIESLIFYISNGGGSRGARVICSERASYIPQSSNENLSEFRIVPENVVKRNEIIVAKYDGSNILISERQVKDFPNLDDIFFEKNWPDFLNGDIFN